MPSFVLVAPDGLCPGVLCPRGRLPGVRCARDCSSIGTRLPPRALPHRFKGSAPGDLLLDAISASLHPPASSPVFLLVMLPRVMDLHAGPTARMRPAG